jgi:phosphoadenosine phosphosulfate reductase
MDEQEKENQELNNKIKISIQRLKSFEPPEGYRLAFSGGKDSVVIKALADIAGVKYTAHYSLTTVDPPELVRFIKTFKDVIIDKPRENMWNLIVRKKTPPLRMSRYCCSELKERYGVGEITITGVRWSESIRRKKNRNLVNIGNGNTPEIIYNDDNDESRRSVEQCYRTQKTLVNPIIDWTEDDVWDFIHKYNVRYCSLYDEGFKRLGCIGCPMSGKKGMKRDFDRWPQYKRAYIRAFGSMIENRKLLGMRTNWQSGEECFNWWMGDTITDSKYKKVKKQNNKKME